MMKKYNVAITEELEKGKKETNAGFYS